MGSSILLDLTGGAALLLWGLHMVHSGIVRAFGSDLRRFLGIALRNRFLAFLAGMFITALLQSSTATGLMTASFVTGGTLDLVPALAVMLGANVGTTLIVHAYNPPGSNRRAVVESADGGGTDVGCAFQRRGRVARDVAVVFELHYPA